MRGRVGKVLLLAREAAGATSFCIRPAMPDPVARGGRFGGAGIPEEVGCELIYKDEGFSRFFKIYQVGS